ncbi:hypothetical protein [Streptomyces sp. NPDC058206]|uniref:hypothetical protein n=1 Tax=Streptomyces sp. NPDC058206 TaxID=3346382 RepID=UPI0036F1090E
MRSDGFWWLGFDGALPRTIEQLSESEHNFAITRILAAPHEQDDDIARRLQQRLLSDHQASLGATLVDQTDCPSLAAFRSWGRRDVGEVCKPPDPTICRALTLPVGERTNLRLNGLARRAWSQWPG